jgi:two-component system, NtrC family, nitrogen regulation response regulator NtrX
MKILIADDDENLRKGLVNFLQREGFDIVPVANGKLALETATQNQFDLIISDVQMPEMNGLELLESLRKNKIHVPFIIITAFATVENAVKAMQMGADDYVTKPLNLLELKMRIDKVQRSLKLQDENKKLKDRLRSIEYPEIVGFSKSIHDMRAMIHKVAADKDVSVMIYGASGTGKEVVAKSIHLNSARRNNPFVAINCAALPDELLESELFGYEKGAFTGAMKSKEGLFQTADGGTLFLDEVGEMSERLQAKLLRVIEDYTIQPLGSTRQNKIDVRVIGASNKKLIDLVKAYSFREDLYYRLHVVEINLPLLKERREDIPLLIDHFLQFGGNSKKITFSAKAVSLLQNYSWPGNVRELQNIVRMLQVLYPAQEITDEMIPEIIIKDVDTMQHDWSELLDKNDFQSAQKQAIEKFERKFLKFHLNRNDGNIAKTAENINLSRVSLYKKIKQYDLSVVTERKA